MRFDDTTVQGIIAGRRRVGRSLFPGSKEIEIGIRALTDSDIDLARFNAHLYLSKRCKDFEITLADFVNIDPESLDREHMRQVLLASIVDIDTPSERPKPFFESIEQVRSLDSVLVQQLWEQYVEWQDTVNPRFRLTEKEVSELIASLKDQQTAEVILAPFARETLGSLVRFLAAQLATSQTGNSSTSPPC